MTPEEFANGMDRIGIATRQPADAATKLVYYDSLRYQVDAQEWDRFTQYAVDTDRFPVHFPKLAEIRDALRDFRGQRPLIVEASEAYERVLAAGVYTPEGGTTWNYRSIREKCGDAAAEAFLAAGGNSAFATTWNEDKRRERFVAMYAEAVRDEPTAALLPPASVKALPPAEAPPTREEATSVIRKLQDLAGVEPAKPAAPVVTLSKEREAELARQAEQILAEEVVPERNA